METRSLRRCLSVGFVLLAAVALLFGAGGTVRAEGEPAWQVQITTQLPAESAAAQGGLEGLQAQIAAGVQAYGAQAHLEELGMNDQGWAGYRLTLQGEKLESFRQAVWNLPPAFSLLGGAAELTLQGAAEGELTLILESNPSTGYGWQVALPEGFTRTAEDSSERKAPGGVVGASERLTLHLAGAGQAQLSLRYARSFEPDEAATRIITVNVPLSGTIDLSDPNPVDYGPEPEGAEVAEPPAEVEAEALPANFDWRSKVVIDEHGTIIPVVPAIRNQGSCGSCYAFGTAGVMESAMNRKRDQEDLSEQFLVSCTQNYNKGCNGGYTATHKYHFTTLAQQQAAVGAVLEADMPYTSGSSGSAGTCNSISDHTYRLTAWAKLRMAWWEEPTTTELKSAIYNFGPITAGICVADNNTAPEFFKQYTGGYFSHDEGGYCLHYGIVPSTNHEIILVGWETYNGSTYFILRNSWGASWGENGYMKIKAGTSNLGQDASYVNYNSRVDHTPPYVKYLNSLNPTADGRVLEGETIRVGVKRLNVYYSEMVHWTSATPEAVFSLFNSSDDKNVAINTATFSNTANSSYVYVNGGAYLPDADYIFTINSTWVRDSREHALDGERDGFAGGNYVRHFRISRPPAAPALLTPANNAYISNNSPRIEWADAPTALTDRYRIQLSKFSDFSTRLVDTTMNGNWISYANLPEGRYYWRVRSYNRFDYAGSWSPVSTFVVDTITPAAPVLYTPLAGAVVRGTPSYTWRAAAGAYKYQLHVWNPADPGAYDYHSTWTTLLTLKPPPQPALPTTGTVYNWQVQAVDRAGNTSPLSAVRTVTIKQPTSGAPVIIGPANGEYLNESDDQLKWKPLYYAVSYHLQISKTSTFSTKVYDGIITDTLLDLSRPVAATGTYWWRVRAVNGEGVKGYFSAPRYFILDYIPPWVPALDRPGSYASLSALPVLYWKTAAGAYQYKLHIYNELDYHYYSVWTTNLYRAAPSDLTNGFSYYWQVKARDQAGNESAYSNPWIFTLRMPY